MFLGLEAACLAWLCAAGNNRGGLQTNIGTMIGSDACRAELHSEDVFGLSLDNSQRARVEVRKLGGKPTLLLIQYANSNDRCGTVRDILVAPDQKDVFEFECTDQADPHRVVIGIRRGSPGAASWRASKAWIVDFAKLKLNAITDPVKCINYSYAGTDDGSDIRSRSGARADKQKGTAGGPPVTRRLASPHSAENTTPVTMVGAVPLRAFRRVRTSAGPAIALT